MHCHRCAFFCSSPFGYRGRHDLDDDDRRTFNCSSAIAGSCASLLGKEPQDATAWSARLINFTAIAAGLLILANYTATLTSFYTVNALTPQIASFQEVVAQQLPWATLRGSSMYAWVASNADTAIRSSLSRATLVATYDEAVALVESGDVVAAFGTTPAFEYYVRQPPCDAIITGLLAEDNYFALALSPSLPSRFSSVSWAVGHVSMSIPYRARLGACRLCERPTCGH